MFGAGGHVGEDRWWQEHRWWFWMAVLIVCLVGGTIRAWQNNHRRTAYQAWQQRCTRLDQAAVRVHERVQSLWGQRGADGRWRELSRSELERELNDGQPLKTTTYGQLERALWTDPQSGRQFRLDFRDGQWCGVSSKWSRSFCPPAPTPTSLDSFTARIRTQFTVWGRVLWIALLVLCVVLRSRRALLAEAMLGLAIFCSTAALVAPNYTLTLSGVFSNDGLGLGALMVAFSAGLFVIWRRPKEPSSAPLCAHCGYNLTGNVSGVCP